MLGISVWFDDHPSDWYCPVFDLYYPVDGYDMVISLVYHTEHMSWQQLNITNMSGNITCVYLCADNVWNIYANENIFHWNLNHCQSQNVDQYIISEVAGHVCSISLHFFNHAYYLNLKFYFYLILFPINVDKTLITQLHLGYQRYLILRQEPGMSLHYYSLHSNCFLLGDNILTLYYFNILRRLGYTSKYIFLFNYIPFSGGSRIFQTGWGRGAPTAGSTNLIEWRKGAEICLTTHYIVSKSVQNFIVLRHLSLLLDEHLTKSNRRLL